ncbi:hypothetical protein [Nannocystis sp.]|uniref:hypothetical protein n=1 Tax=Nannocystis sp. TaxID=1962667 RepID=UPI0024216E07|nr:hypothetical protein [Nannocystis sp.]MBK7824526.1 hypothetical protein [Nannocystis sp.]MBK9753223.1 hypothetical protein [Nannocystis sp.]
MLLLRAPRMIVPALLVGLAFGTAHAGEPQVAATDDGVFQQARTTAQAAKDRATNPGPVRFERDGCLSDPKQCKCQDKDPAKAALCSGILGHFCPDSTLRYLAAACMDLFGGATLCQCAATQQIESYIKAEDAAKAKAEKKEKAKAKKAK